MSEYDNEKPSYHEKAVPSSRFSRVAKLGSLAGSLTGNIIKNTVSAAVKAQKPTVKNTLLHLDNAKSVTKHLSQMRGAAMKLGQMLSMDAGEILPAEWEPILAMLREKAHCMPKQQLLDMLQSNWTANWQEHFDYFDFEPIAAASIGQVHRARLKTGEELAIKVQYPGVANSIDSDLENVAGLLKLTRLIPKGIDIDSILQQAKQQLKQEANYLSELDFLSKFKTLLADDPRYIVPAPYAPLSTQEVLCMEYINARPMTELAYETKNTKNTVMTHLFELLFEEMFRFKFVQSDPNFANFLFNPDTRQVVLLDFGACRTIRDSVSDDYKNVAFAMQKQDKEQILASLLKLGLLNEHNSEEMKNTVIEACITASESVQNESYNFKQAQIISRLQAQTKSLMNKENAIAAPDFDVALVNRKVAGIVLLANKLDVDIELKELLNRYR